MTYDPKCYDLALAFLSDVPSLQAGDTRERLAHELAQQLQHTAEDFLAWLAYLTRPTLTELRDDAEERERLNPKPTQDEKIDGRQG